jgi:transposase
MARQAKIDAIALRVASGQSLRAAAKSEGVPERTARDWSAKPEFKALVNKLREHGKRSAEPPLAPKVASIPEPHVSSPGEPVMAEIEERAEHAAR